MKFEFKYSSMYLYFDELSTNYYLGEIPKFILDIPESIELSKEQPPIELSKEQSPVKQPNKELNDLVFFIDKINSSSIDMLNVKYLSKNNMDNSFFKYNNYITIYNYQKSKPFLSGRISHKKVTIINKIWEHIHKRDNQCCYVYTKHRRCKNPSIDKKYVCKLHNKYTRYSTSKFLFFVYKSENYKKLM